MILLLPLVFFTNADARSIKVPEKHFSISVQTEYSTRWYKVYNESGKWICQTTALPYIEAGGNPLKSLDWKVLVARVPLSGCRQKVLIRDLRSDKERKAEGCLTDTGFSKFVAAVDRGCQP